MSDFDQLLAGYHRFKADGWGRQHARWAELAEGQSPRTLVIACSDSRVDPAQIFDVSPGELFVVRNIAALVPPYEPDAHRHGVSAALEFAVTQLEVSEIVVMGHGQCGGVAAALSQRFQGMPPGEGGFIDQWIGLLHDARDSVVAAHGHGPEAAGALEWETVRVSLRNLRTFPFVAEREAAGRLKLIGAWFAIRDGVLHVMSDDGVFRAA